MLPQNQWSLAWCSSERIPSGRCYRGVGHGSECTLCSISSVDRCAPLSDRQSTCQLLKGCLFSTSQLCTNGKDMVADSSNKSVLCLVPQYQSAVQWLLDTLLWRHRETGCCSLPGPNFLLQQLHQLVQLPVIAAHLPADHQLKLLRQLGQ